MGLQDGVACIVVVLGNSRCCSGIGQRCTAPEHNRQSCLELLYMRCEAAGSCNALVLGAKQRLHG